MFGTMPVHFNVQRTVKHGEMSALSVAFSHLQGLAVIRTDNFGVVGEIDGICANHTGADW